MQYVIKWTVKRTGATGYGTGKFTLEEAEKEVEFLNDMDIGEFTYKIVSLIELEKILPPDINTIVRWCGTFNYWKWPIDFPNKPDGFDMLPNSRTINDPYVNILPDKFTLITPIVRQLRSIAGSKECLRYHYTHNLGRTDEQFEQWWAKDYERELSLFEG